MFHTCELTGCGGKTFQLDLEIVWHHVDALCCSWNAMEPGWAKACPEVGEGFNIFCDLFVEWAEILLSYNSQHPLCCWIWGIVAQNPSLRGFPRRAYSCVIALEGCHRTPEDPIALHIYSQIFVLHKRHTIQEKPSHTAKNHFFEKMNLKRFFYIFFSLRR